MGPIHYHNGWYDTTRAPSLFLKRGAADTQTALRFLRDFTPTTMVDTNLLDEQ